MELAFESNDYRSSLHTGSWLDGALHHQGLDELVPGAYGILEPDPNKAKRCDASFIPDVVIVPGLAFDLQGGRLGYGGGYYDRFNERLHQLAAYEDKQVPLWIGAGYESQLLLTCQWISMMPG